MRYRSKAFFTCASTALLLSLPVYASALSVPSSAQPEQTVASVIAAEDQYLASFGSIVIHLLGNIHLFGGVHLATIGGAYGTSWVLPNASVDLDFANSRYYGDTLSNMVSDTRASIAYASDNAGNLTLFGSNVPRITNQGLLIEGTSTNLVVQSQAFDNASWSKTNGGAGSVPTVTADYALAPDSTMTADRIQFNLNAGNTTSDLSRITSASVSGMTVGATYQESIYLKSNTSSSYLVKVQESGNGTNMEFLVTPVWQRFSFSFTSGFTTDTIRIELQGGLTPKTATSADISAWGEQLETGAFVTSYIPTTSTSATRAADVVQLAGVAASSALSAKSLFAQTSGVQIGTTTGQRIVDYNGSQAVYYPTSFAVRATNGSNNADGTISSTGAISDLVKTAAAFDSSSITVLANGGTKATSANSWGTPSGSVYIGNRSAGDLALNGYLQRIAFSASKGVFDALTSSGLTVNGDDSLYGYSGTQPYFTFLAPFNKGSYVYGTNYVETVSMNPSTFPNGTSASWFWSNTPSNGIYGFSEIGGFGDYDGGPSPYPVQAKQINNITTLTASHDLTLAGQTQNYDVIYDMFLTSVPNNDSDHLFEIEVFAHTPSSAADYVLGTTPIGTYTDSNGVVWTVNIDNTLSVHDILFMPANGEDVSNQTIDLLAMFNYLKGQSVLAGSEYFNGFALGVEQKQGSGSVKLNSFSVIYH